ncbi:MAG: transcription antitermination factor NusB [Acidimicrobiia bacterium]|nr:transcription antitermination factor NusB [Acidimicrobiia bacterium]MXZ84099.1 transcription antitermination factor NusB [Acidimicrobiia bacterium]MYE72609.1 transcription antitermination factor NusB [Acidimicrobiia bacterium]MYG72243.1 transcription antitermination factor NusB [Acidimicrobiia bacterium]MYJ62885.1 transcription antitermination factor NusB [Acidimicrobiia bacterium]
MSSPDPLVSGSQRRQVRERALGLLYEAEAKGIDMAELLAAQELPLDPYAHTLVTGAADHQSDIDARLEELSENWPVARMPALDRAILRLASFELAHSTDLSVAVIINEAVELAHEYSTPASAGFINGLLSQVATSVRSAPEQ